MSAQFAAQYGIAYKLFDAVQSVVYGFFVKAGRCQPFLKQARAHARTRFVQSAEQRTLFLSVAGRYEFERFYRAAVHGQRFFFLFGCADITYAAFLRLPYV